MSRHLSRTRALVLVLAATVALLAACSSDKGDDTSSSKSTDKTTSSTSGTSAHYAKWCEVVAKGDTTTDKGRLASVKAQLEVAPSDLKDDLEAVEKLLELRTDPNADAVDLAAAAQDGTPAFVRVVQAMKDECGVTVDVFNS